MLQSKAYSCKSLRTERYNSRRIALYVCQTRYCMNKAVWNTSLQLLLFRSQRRKAPRWRTQTRIRVYRRPLEFGILYLCKRWVDLMRYQALVRRNRDNLRK